MYDHVCTFVKDSKGNYISNVLKLRHEQHWQNHLFPKKLIQECEVAGEQCGDPVAHTTSFFFQSLQLQNNHNR